jgi:hypothetical protein
MGNPVYRLTLQRTYYDKGFFNLGVDVSGFVRKTSGPATLLLGPNRVPVQVGVNRDANQNGTPRIMGGANVRDWIQRNLREMEVVNVEILDLETYWLRR